MNIKRYVQKGKQSICKFRVSAFAFTAKGNFLDSSVNSPRFSRKGGGNHAEMILMKKHGKKIKTIIISRIGKSGKLRPIHPCSSCRRVAKKLGIKIKTIENN